jgi:hypothetical protein
MVRLAGEKNVDTLLSELKECVLRVFRMVVACQLTEFCSGVDTRPKLTLTLSGSQ